MKDAQDVMAITWNIDEARATIRAQMDEANRLDAVIDEIASERDAANAEVAHLRSLYTNEHDIAQEQLDRAKAAEAEVGRLQTVLDQWERCGNEVMLCAALRYWTRRAVVRQRRVRRDRP